MNTQKNELQTVLQALALPVTGQLRLYPHEACKVSKLIQAFEQSEPKFLATWEICLNEAQRAVLGSLRQDLMHICLEPDHVCTDVALRQSEKWRRVRLLARSALVTFGWPLSLPPQFERAVA
ncbi:MAG: hypothetical protein DHS20C20_03850 [Ardenticatenaceae bacterium]|nr:MAG: hypothetical protein DHS20C20_03850 [Ardenticatenaceae bacterium]